MAMRQVGPLQAADERRDRHEVFYFREETLVGIGVVQRFWKLFNLWYAQRKGGEE